jgi:hypothetical protein
MRLARSNLETDMLREITLADAGGITFSDLRERHLDDYFE